MESQQNNFATAESRRRERFNWARWASLAVVIALFLTLACQSKSALFAQSPNASATNATLDAPAVMPRASYADVVARVTPAVVTIRSERRVRAPQQFPFADDPMLREFFGRQFGGRQPQMQPQVQKALGSGVIVSPDGYILTNHHVIDGAEDIKVELNDNRTVKAKVVGSDAPSDLAVLKIDANNLPVLPLGDSDRARIGDVVLAVGNPLGVGQTVTMGIISAKGRQTELSNGTFEDFIQTDAPINQGNSGGALVNTNGELVGINSQILSQSGGSIGIGFAIPSNMAKTVMEQLIKNGKVRRGQLGVIVQKVTSDLAESMNLKSANGVVVSQVQSGSAAEKAGLKVGDVITAINGTTINDPNEFRNKVAGTAPGSDVTLNVVRDNREQQIRATLGEFKAPKSESESASNDNSPASAGKLGIGVTPLTPDAAQALKLPAGTQGLLVGEVDPSGPAADAGIQQNDVIVEVNRQPVRSVDDLKSALAKNGTRTALLLINRGGETVFVPVKPRQ